MAFAYAFDDFGCPPGFDKETILELVSAFFEVRDFDDFRAKKLRFFLRGRRQGGCPPKAFLKLFLGCYPITACSPSARGAPNLKASLLPPAPLSTKNC